MGSRMNVISRYLTLKIEQFKLWLLFKSYVKNFATETMKKFDESKQFSIYKKDNIIHIIDQIKVQGYRCESGIQKCSSP